MEGPRSVSAETDARPLVALLVSSYQRPHHLARVLASIECQQGLTGPIEVVVTDDGSTDETAAVVAAFAERVDFRVQYTTHRHQTFQLARCRNEGVAVSSAKYLLFLDGDCLIPPDHVRQHLLRRRPGVVMAGYCCRLDRQVTEQLTLDDVYDQRYLERVDRRELQNLARIDRKARLYCWLRHPNRPKLFGGNVGIDRKDYERVNGYDEQFQGWGCEDDDLRLRLRRAGIRIQSILRWTRTYHLWHPPGETTPEEWRQGSNVGYLRSQGRPVFCRRGLSRYRSGEAAVEVRPGRLAVEAVRTLVNRRAASESRLARIKSQHPPSSDSFNRAGIAPRGSGESSADHWARG